MKIKNNEFFFQIAELCLTLHKFFRLETYFYYINHTYEYSIRFKIYKRSRMA